MNNKNVAAEIVFLSAVVKEEYRILTSTSLGQARTEQIKICKKCPRSLQFDAGFDNILKLKGLDVQPTV
jgi:hypothetical protein